MLELSYAIRHPGDSGLHVTRWTQPLLLEASLTLSSLSSVQWFL